MRIIRKYPLIKVKRNPPFNIPGFDPPYFHREQTIGGFKILEISNAKCSPYGVVFHKGRVLNESVYSMFSARRNRWTFYKKSILGRVKKINGTCLVCHNAYYSNYYHWLTEVLPRLFICREFISNCQLIVPKKLSRFHIESLEFFGIKNLIQVDDHELVYCSNLILPMHTSIGLSHYEPIVENMSKWMLQSAKTSTAQKSKMYLSRKNADKRLVINESKVLSILTECGFEEVFLEELSFKEQIRAFSRTELAVGPHGAGFANMMFLPKRSKLICFMNQLHPDPAFINLANVFDHEFNLLLCQDPEYKKKGSNPQVYDLLVPIEKLEQVLK